MIVNEVKTKFMVFGRVNTENLCFNGKPIEEVSTYKYLGNVISKIQNPGQDIFKENYSHLSNQARKAMFGLKKKIQMIGQIPPHMMFELFEKMITPILSYGSDIWGLNQCGTEALDKVFLYFVRCVLQIKGTTSNVITLGECGRVPPSVSCRASTICFMNRVSSMPDTTLVKQVLNSLMNLHDQGFKTWVSPVFKVMRELDINPSSDKNAFNKKCKQTLIENFKTDWGKNLRDIQRNPILRTYNTFKQRYVTEPYLYLVKNIKYRVALSRFRSSSHTLEIERGRYVKPIIPVQERLCRVCLVLEDERHLLFHCVLYDGERRQLLSKIEARYNGCLSLDIHQMWSFLLSNEDCQCLTWLGKYLYDAFEIRNRYIASISDGNVLWAGVNIHWSRFATCPASWKKVYVYWSYCMCVKMAHQALIPI